MPIDYSPGLPPIPNGITVAQLSILREELGEDTIQKLIEIIQTSSGATGTLLRALPSGTGQVQASEDEGIRWRRFLPSENVYDLRDGGSTGVPTPETSGDATDAIQQIFAEITANPASGTAARNAVVLVPKRATGALWTIEEEIGIVGGVGQSFSMIGEEGPSIGGVGAGFRYTGVAGGTLFRPKGLNNSIFKNICFSGNSLARKVVHASQYWGPRSDLGGANGQIPSSNVKWVDCIFMEPQANSASILFAAGSDDDSPNTLQTSEYKFFRPTFYGHGTVPGWGFKALIRGNTKNFEFHSPNFNFLYRAVESLSGDCTIICPTCVAIGYGGPADSCLFYAGGDMLTVVSPRYETSVGYATRLWITEQGTQLNWMGGYISLETPSDDYAGISGGATRILNTGIANERVGSNSVKFQASYPTKAGGRGGIRFEEVKLPYNTSPLTAFPIYDGSNNLLGRSEGQSATDYARGTAHRTFCEGNFQGLRGGTINEPIPGFTGDRVPCMIDTVWTQGQTVGCTTLKNDSGELAITIPASIFAANAGVVTLGKLPRKSKITDVLIDPTTGFSGTGLSGTIEIALGRDNGSVLDVDSLIEEFDIKTTPTLHGDDAADLGTDLAYTVRNAADSGSEYVRKPCYTSFANDDTLKLTLTVGAGLIANLSAGSLTVYLHWARLT